MNVYIKVMETCIATILEGSRKGKLCQFPPSDNGYCGRHQRNYQYAELLKEGKTPCRFFFRGCDTLVEKNGACQICKSKMSKKHINCGHEGCMFKTSGDKYCKKHIRDVYRDEEKEKGIRYCDINRGCFTVCREGAAKCEICREKSLKKEKELGKKRMEIHNAIEHIPNSNTQLCVNCGKDYEQFITRYNKPSKICKECNNYNKTQDTKRKIRTRNFKNESFKNLERYYSVYINSATKRNLTISLEFDDFKKMVLSPCYYCKYFKEEEVNGIDRLNNSIGYEKNNCVPCCTTCNMMKWIYDSTFFIEICKIISGFKESTPEFYASWKQYYINTSSRSWANYKKHSEIKRKLPFHISRNDWYILIKQPCYLCGFKSKKGIGIDRIDNSKREYRLENVKPCCGTCNNIKRDLSFEQLVEKAALISSVWPDKAILESIPLC